MIILTHLKYITPMFKTLETLEEEEEEKRRMMGMDVPCNSFTCLVEHTPGVRYCVKKTQFLLQECSLVGDLQT